MFSSAYKETYSSSGNLQSKTGVGNYAYSSGSHRLSSVDNTDDVIPYSNQSITYNAWGKVAEVNETVGSDTYKYELTYGPDLQRVLAVLWKNNTLVHLVTYGDGYEEKYQNGHITNYYYVDGADGNKCFSASYDPWGRRYVEQGSIEYDRGYTGHEHIDELALIDMNGRMYDPILGRFISVDPYIQDPNNPQNFNRYAYCLNNPVKYTDPDGESIVGAMIVGAIIGTYSGGILANEGQINPVRWDWKSKKTWSYMGGGMITGALSGAVGAVISSSGIPMANTLGIANSSLLNSSGTFIYTKGETPLTISFGIASYNISDNSWGYLGKKGNNSGTYSNLASQLTSF
ncbi:MAG: RHS repeat-associated core domain-containing protein [Bacteroidaceae bacterium]|nr:RHS repeat-associated core domain-containing protein [Bacteroidaceae bacterium]